MLPVSLDFRFVFLHLVNPLNKMKKNKTTIQRNWQHRRYTRSRKTKQKSRETGNIGGTQDEEKQNDNPEAT
jgi:hypothetical protein